MATLYKVKVNLTSPFVNYSEKDIELIFEKFLKNYHKESVNGLGFEGIEIKVERCI